MRHFKFVPTYYEWHLVDDSNNVLHNWVMPEEDLYDADTDEPIPPEELKWLCKDNLETADRQYAEGEDYNGILLNNLQRLTAEEITEASEIMFKALIDYYFTGPASNTEIDRDMVPLPEDLPF